MKKIEYQAPAMEVIKMYMKGSVLLEASGQPGYNDTPVME